VEGGRAQEASLKKGKPEYYYWVNANELLCCLVSDDGRIDSFTKLVDMLAELTEGRIPDRFKDALEGPYRVKKYPRPCPEVWKHIKARILRRDDYTCAYCGKRGGKLEVDHILPISRGGEHDDANLTAACAPCNRRKSNKTVKEWRGAYV